MVFSKPKPRAVPRPISQENAGSYLLKERIINDFRALQFGPIQVDDSHTSSIAKSLLTGEVLERTDGEKLDVAKIFLFCILKGLLKTGEDDTAYKSVFDTDRKTIEIFFGGESRMKFHDPGLKRNDNKTTIQSPRLIEVRGRQLTRLPHGDSAGNS